MGMFAWIVQRLATQSIALACIGTPFVWVSLEFARARLPEISFPWNLLGYPAAANLGLIQLTSITGIYGLSFLVAAFNALLAWAEVGTSRTARRRLGTLAAAATCIIAVMLIGPRLVPKPQANHMARAVQLNFPEAPEYGSNWFAEHTGDMQEAARLVCAPATTWICWWPEAGVFVSRSEICGI